MTNRTPWIDTENGGLVSLYFSMIDHVAAGTPYSKAAMIRDAINDRTQCAGLIPPPYAGTLANRSRGSIEFKLMNASAAHADIDSKAETMHGHGYRALPNYQASLKQAMATEITQRYLDDPFADGARLPA